jgi:hypothetical protein
MKRWQFSTRSLLFLMAMVSAVLAFAVSLPDVFRYFLLVASVSLFVAALLQSANFLTSDRRPLLAMLAWSILGMFFALFAFLCFRAVLVLGMTDVIAIGLGLVMGSCCMVCGYRALRSFLLIWRRDAEAATARSAANDGSRT